MPGHDCESSPSISGPVDSDKALPKAPVTTPTEQPSSSLPVGGMTFRLPLGVGVPYSPPLNRFFIMLHFFRRHRGAFLVTLTIVIIISFSVFGAWRFDKNAEVRALPTDHAMTVFGKDYTIAEASKVSRSLQFSMRQLQMYDLYFKLIGLGPKDGGGGEIGMIGTVLALQHVLDQAGVRASDKEALEALQQLPSLMPNGQFDPSQAQRMEEMAGMYGMTSTDLLDLMRLKIGVTKLEELLSKNYAASSLAAEKQYVSSQQIVKVSTIAFNTDDFKKDVKVTDDEIKKSYEETKENYMTDEKRAVKYVFFEAPKDQDKIPLEEREKAKRALSDRVNQFSDKVRDEGRKADLDKIAAEFKEKVLTLPAFAQEAPPEAVKGESTFLKAVFELTPKAQPVSDTVKTEKGWYIFSVPTIEEPKQKELAAVKDEIKEKLVTQKATEARTKAVNEIRDFILAGLKDKKKIEDLAKEKKLTLSAVTTINSASPPPATELPNAPQIAQAAAKTAVGDISQAVDTEKGNVLVFVNAKELYKSDNAASMRKQQAEGLSSKEREGLFQAWFARKLEEAAIKTAVRDAA